MAVKENDWFAINLLNDDVNALDLVSNNITVENTGLQSREHYKSLKSVQEKFKTNSGKFDEVAFNKAYDSALYTYNNLATEDYEKKLLTSMEQDPDYWLDPGAKVRSTSATISLSEDPYHRGAGLSGLQSISDPNWSVREIAQAQEATDEEGNGLGWTPNDHALFSGSLKALWQPTLALASWDEDGYHEDEYGNKIRHRKGEYKLNKDGEFYYEKLGSRSAVGKDLLRFSDTVTVDGTWLNKLDVFDADSIDKSVGGTIVRTALEIAPILIPGVNKIWGILGAVYNTAEVMPTLAKTLNNIFGGGEETELGGKLNRASNWFKRFSDTQSDTGREKFMSFEQIGSQIAGIGNQLYQQKFVGQLGYMLSSGGKHFQNGSKIGKAFSTTYMAATSGMDSYDIAKEAGANDFWAGVYTLGVMAGFYGLMSSSYYKDALFGENSLLNEEFVTRNTVKAVGQELNAALRGVPAEITPIEARGFFQRAFEATKRNGGKFIKKIKQGFSKGNTGEALATAETTEAATRTAETAAARLTAAEIEGKAAEAVKNGILGKSSAGTSWFNIMLNRASNEAVEEMMEEAMQDTGKALLKGAEALGLNVKDEKADDLDFGFSFEDFMTRYLTAGIGGFVGGSLFAGLDKWEQIWSPNMRDITSRGISNGERFAYIIKEGGKKNLLDHINKLEKIGAFGSKDLSFKGSPYTTMDGKTVWNFEHTNNESESQNATIANGLRAYVEYIERTMSAYNLIVPDSDLSKILRNTDAENKEAVEVLKRESPFTYSQLEKEMNKENKRRKKNGEPEITIQDVYEKYNYADATIRAMDKCGFFQDFYHDYLMLGTKLIGLQYNLDCKAQDYKLEHPHDNSGWNDDPTKKRLEEKIKDIEKQREAIMNGEKNTDYIQRAIYMAYDPVNTVFTENEGEMAPLAESSVFNYAMSRYGLDLHDPEITTEEKEQINKEFEDYKKLKSLEKVKASYDIFINLANAFNPELENYIKTETVKGLNEHFGIEVNAEELGKKINALKEKLATLQQQIRNYTPDTVILDSWDEEEKKYVTIFQNLGISLGSISWDSADSARLNGAEGFYDETTNSFVFAKGKDPEETKRTIIHEVIGHYGLRQLLDGPMKYTFQQKLRDYQSKHPEVSWTTPIGEFGSNAEQLMEVLYNLADEDVKTKINSTREKYGYKEDTFNSAWTNWDVSTDKDSKIDYLAAKQILSQLKKNGQIIIGEGSTDADKATAKKLFDKWTQRIATEEYLAELAATQITDEDLTKSESNWLLKILDFFKDIFDIDRTDSKLNELFFTNLMKLSKDNLRNTANKNIIEKFIKPHLQRDKNLIQRNKLNPNNFTKEQIEARINKIYSNWKTDNFIENYTETLKGGETEFPSFNFRTLGNAGNRKWIKINNFSELIELLTFGTTNKVAEADSLQEKTLNCPFIGFGFKGRELKNGLRVIGVNTQNITPELFEELTNKIHAIDPKIKVVPYTDLGVFEDFENGLTFIQFVQKLNDTLGNEVINSLSKEELLQLWTGETSLVDGKLGWDDGLNIPDFSEGGGEWTNELPVFFATKILPSATNLGTTIVISEGFDDNIKSQLKGKNPKLTFVGVIDGKSVFVGNDLKDKFVNNNEIQLVTMSPEESNLRYEEVETRKELDELDKLTYAARQTETEIGKGLTRIFDSIVANILTPGTDVSSEMAAFMGELQRYAEYCNDKNVIDPNMEYVYQKINEIKSALKARIKYNIISQIEDASGKTKAFIEKVLDQYYIGNNDSTLDNYINTIVESDFANNSSAKSTAILEINSGLESVLPTLLPELGETLEYVQNPTECIYGEELQSILTQFVPNNEALMKFYELMNFDRLGETIKLSSWVKLMLQGTEPGSQMRLQDYVMENADAKELIDNVKLTHRILKAFAGAGRSWFGMIGLFDMFNMYAPNSDFYVYMGDVVPEVLTQELNVLENKLGFLGQLAGLSTERQIKVQKEIAKGTYFNLMRNLIGLGKIFNVDIPELWERAGGTNIDSFSQNMSDSDFARFFEIIKKFEHIFFEEIHNSEDFKAKSNEARIADIVNLIDESERNLYSGTIADGKINLSKYTIGAYVISLMIRDSNDFYSKLKTVATEIPDLKTPFPAQLFAIKLADAFMNDSDNLITEYSKLMRADKDLFIENVMGIFGSAGTGKTTVIANTIAQINKNKNIFYSTNGNAQLKKLVDSINNATEEKGFIIQDLIDEVAPDWNTNYKIEGTALQYTGTVKSSSKYDDKLKDGILIVDESTKIDPRKWQALAQYAKIYNIKILALGDLKQVGESEKVESIITLFTDLKMFSTPILTESIRPANQAQRNNLLIFGKVFDDSISILQEMGSIDSAVRHFKENPFTLKYKDATGKLIGTKVINDNSEFKAKIKEVERNLKDGETIAIITDSHDYDTLASEKVQIVPVKDAQGNEWTYVFSDFEFNNDMYLTLQETYTLISRAQQGTLILENSSKLENVGITFAEDSDGDLKVSANKNQFTNYNNWMKKILFDTTEAPIPESTEAPSEEVSSEVPEGVRHRFLSEYNSTFLENPDVYVKDIDNEIVSKVLDNAANNAIVTFNGKPIAELNGNQYVVVQLNKSSNLIFIKQIASDGSTVFKPVKLNSTGGMEIDLGLLKSRTIQTLGNYLVGKLDKEWLDKVEKINDINLLTKNIITGQNAQTAFEDFITSNALNIFSDAENLLQQGSFKGDDRATRTLEKTRDSFNRAKLQANNIDDNFYVKKLAGNYFGNTELNNLFLPGVSNENKQQAIKIIADLVKLDARKVSGTATKVSEIDSAREKYIKEQLGLVFDNATINLILNEIFKDYKTFRVKDTSVAFDKELYLVVGDAEIYIGEIRNAQWEDGYYKNNDRFSVAFYRSAISSGGRSRTNVEDLFKEGMFNFAPPAVVIGDAKINALFAQYINQSAQHPDNVMLSNFVEWMRKNNGKTMQAYTNISYLDMRDPSNVYQVQMHNNGFVLNPETGEKTTVSYPYAYNDMFGDLMGVQKVISLKQLYTYSILVKYAQTGDSSYGQMANVAFSDVHSQADAIRKVEQILGSSAEMQAIPEHSLKAKRADIIWENTRKFNTSGLLLNMKNTEKIETMMLLAALQSGNSDFQQFLMAFQLFAQTTSRKKQNYGGLSFKYYDNTNMKGEPETEYTLTVSRAGKNASWKLYEITRSGDAIKRKEITTWNSAVITPELFTEAIAQIMSSRGLSGNVNDFLNEGHMSIQPCIDWTSATKDGTKSGISTMNIADFFVTLLSNPNLGKVSNLFPICEQIFDSNNGKGLFRSGIYLETRSTGANYISQNGSSQDSFWKKDVTQGSDIPYSTDIIKIYNPIRTLNLLPTTKPGITPTYDWKSDFKDISPLDEEIANSVAKTATTKEEFLAKLNSEVREANKDAIKIRQYSEDGGKWIWNEEKVKEKGNIVEDLGKRIIVEKDGNWIVYDETLNEVISFTPDVVERIKQVEEAIPEFKEMFYNVLKGKESRSVIVKLLKDKAPDTGLLLFKMLKNIC